MHIHVQLNCFSSMNTPYYKKEVLFWHILSVWHHLPNSIFHSLCVLDNTHGYDGDIALKIVNLCCRSTHLTLKPPRYQIPTMSVNPLVSHLTLIEKTSINLIVFPPPFFFPTHCTFRALLGV